METECAMHTFSALWWWLMFYVPASLSFLTGLLGAYIIRKMGDD
jgi:hypothetical protein